MAYQETGIRREINLSRKTPVHASNVTFQDLLPALLIDSMRPWNGFLWNFEVFWAFTHSDVTQRWFCPQSDVHVALLQSNTESFTKTLKSCFKVIKRTLRSGKDWLRNSSFSVISRVNEPHLRAWPIFEHFKIFKPTLAKHDIVSKKTQNFELRNGMSCKGCASQKCCNHVCRQSFDFFAEHLAKIPRISPCYPSNRFTKTEITFCPGFL